MALAYSQSILCAPSVQKGLHGKQTTTIRVIVKGGKNISINQTHKIKTVCFRQ